MIQEDFMTLDQNNPTNVDTNEEEAVIRNVFTPGYKKLESWDSEKSNDLYFIKRSSKFSENMQSENLFSRRDSFNLMQSFEDAYKQFMGIDDEQNNLPSEKEDSLISDDNNDFPHFLTADLNYDNHNFVNDIFDGEGVVVNIKNPDKGIIKGKEEEEEEKGEKVKEILIYKEKMIKPMKKKMKRGKRGPYKKKQKAIIQVKTDDKCFPFTSGKGILSDNNNRFKQYIDNTPFRTNKYKNDSMGNKKREKKQRKYKPDDIRKKIKVRFHKKIKNILNENLKKAGANELFSFLPQFFIGNISKKFNYQYMNTTFEKLLSIDFSDFQKEYFNKECDYKQFIKNKKTLEYLKKNPEISKISGFDELKKMKYRDILFAYFSSLEFEHSIEQLEEEKEVAEYIQEYIFLAKSYIEYFTSQDDSL